MTTFAQEISDAEFEDRVLNYEGIVLVDFWAAWCAPCRAMAPFFERLAEEFQGEISFVKVNVEQNPQYSSQLGVRSIPTLILFRKGEILREITGAPDPSKLVELLEETLG